MSILNRCVGIFFLNFWLPLIIKYYNIEYNTINIYCIDISQKSNFDKKKKKITIHFVSVHKTKKTNSVKRISKLWKMFLIFYNTAAILITVASFTFTGCYKLQ